MCGPNPAGMLALFVVRVKHVAFFPRIAAGLLLGSITLDAGISWAFWGFIPETLGFQETERETGHGPQFTQSLQWQIPQDEPQKVGIYDGLRQAELIFLTMDQHEQIRSIGTPDAPARLLTTALVEQGSPGLSGYQCSAQAVSAIRAPFAAKGYAAQMPVEDPADVPPPDPDPLG